MHYAGPDFQVVLPGLPVVALDAPLLILLLVLCVLLAGYSIFRLAGGKSLRRIIRRRRRRYRQHKTRHSETGDQDR
jgi:hypothetical protein